MRVSVLTEHRFLKTGDGYYTSAPFDFTFWQRYLDVFDRVSVVARAAHAGQVPAGWKRADGPGVSFREVPNYRGLLGYVRVLPQLRRALFDAFDSNDAVILRVPSPMAGLIAPRLLRDQRPFAVEVLGDPADVFARGAVTHPLRPLIQRWLRAGLRQQCAGASQAAYVTRKALQRRYPCRVMRGIADPVIGHDALSSAVDYPALSSVVLPEADLPATPPVSNLHDEPVLLCVGSLERRYKGVDLLIRAVADCRAHGRPVVARVVGDGRERRALELLAKRLGVASSVVFTGRLPAGRAIVDEIDRCDLFVLPSRAEGLPRALLEAMSRGKPCIAAAVGGIPELLDRDDLVPKDDWKTLAREIAAALADRSRLTRMAERNLSRARDFTDQALRPQRSAFYAAVAAAAAVWIRNNHAKAA